VRRNPNNRLLSSREQAAIPIVTAGLLGILTVVIDDDGTFWVAFGVVIAGAFLAMMVLIYRSARRRRSDGA
jgi:hypothetical protein